MLDVYSLYSAAPVCRAFRSSVSQVLSSLSTLDLSGFTPTTQIVDRIMRYCYRLQSLTVNCNLLDDSSIKCFAKEHIEELVLLKCHHLSSYTFLEIAQSCSNLRVLRVELVCEDEPHFAFNCNKILVKMFKGCPNLESLSIKILSAYPLKGEFDIIQLHLPKTMKTLLLQPASNKQTMDFILNTQLGVNKNISLAVDVHNPILHSSCLMLHSLSLVLDVITDELVITIMNCLHYLTDLCLEDNPPEKRLPLNDLSNTGFQLLSSSMKLTRLSLSRSRPHTFRRVTDVGILVLAEGCKGLESVRFGGFSKVTDAGYLSILHSCRKLKRFEITYGSFLSDLAFHDIGSVADSLVEIVLISCNLLTSETATLLSSCKNLELLDLRGCRSIADHGLSSISTLRNLTLLDISGADITDSGLSSLALCSSPIHTLRLRGCRRIGDRGFRKLLQVDSAIARTLSTIDLGYLPGVSDETITRIAKMCPAVSSLCIRHCFYVTDASIRSLGKRRSIKGLDLYNCTGLSIDSIKLFYPPYFQGLRWVGFGKTKLHDKERGRAEELSKERPWLTICTYGCEMGCRDHWFLH